MKSVPVTLWQRMSWFNRVSVVLGAVVFVLDAPLWVVGATLVTLALWNGSHA